MIESTDLKSRPEMVVQTAPTRVRWHMVAILIGSSFMTWFNRVSMSVAYDDRLKQDYGISEEVIGSVYSAFFWAYILFMTPGGWFIDRFGARLALIVMGFGSALFVTLTGLIGWSWLIPVTLMLPALFIVRTLMGVFTAPIYPAASRVVVAWMPARNRAFANGLIQGAAGLGMACAFPIFGALIDWYSWPVAFVISGACTVLVAVLWTFYSANSPAEHPLVNASERQIIEDGQYAHDLRKKARANEDAVEPPTPTTNSFEWGLLFRNRSLMLLTLSYAAVGYFEYLFNFWMHHYFEDKLGLGKTQSRIYITILFLAFAAGIPLGGWLSDRLQGPLGYRKARALIPVGGLVLGAVFLCLGLWSPYTWLLVTLLALSLGVIGACESPIWTTAAELGGRQGGTAAAICNTGGNVGGSLAPILTPWIGVWVSRQWQLSEEAGWRWAILCSALFCLLGAALWLWIDPLERIGQDA